MPPKDILMRMLFNVVSGYYPTTDTDKETDHTARATAVALGWLTEEQESEHTEEQLAEKWAEWTGRMQKDIEREETTIDPADWKWMPHGFVNNHTDPPPAFQLTTVIGKYIISTVGEMAKENGECGYRELGTGDTQETGIYISRVFLASERTFPYCGCVEPVNSTSLFTRYYSRPRSAAEGHKQLCEEAATRYPVFSKNERRESCFCSPPKYVWRSFYVNGELRQGWGPPNNPNTITFVDFADPAEFGPACTLPKWCSDCGAKLGRGVATRAEN